MLPACRCLTLSRGQRRQIDGFLKIRRSIHISWDRYIISDITKKSVRPNIDGFLYRALQMRVIMMGFLVVRI